MLKKLLFASFVMVLTACGGGGGGSPSVGDSAPKVTGTASGGDLIVGKTVGLKDATGTASLGSVTSATGTYSIHVVGMTAPFIVTVEGVNGTYISLAQAAGLANINPITTAVIALAAGTADISGLYDNLTPAQILAINNNYLAKATLLTESLRAILPAGVNAADYFTGSISKGAGMDSVFDLYEITVDPLLGIVIKTKGDKPATVLTIPVSTIVANTNDPLPVLVLDNPSANQAPVAKAGTSQKVATGVLVTLDGSASSDVDGDPLVYRWTLVSKPSGSVSILSGATSAKPTFTPDVAGAYVFSLVVSDGKAESAPSSVTVTASASNSPPVADAGAAQNVTIGTVVTLDGSGSSDPDGDALTYSWSLASKPSGSAAVLSSTVDARPTFRPDVVGRYVVNLVVNDGTTNSAISTVSITAKTNTGSISVTW